MFHPPLNKHLTSLSSYKKPNQTGKIPNGYLTAHFDENVRIFVLNLSNVYNHFKDSKGQAGGESLFLSKGTLSSVEIIAPNTIKTLWTHQQTILAAIASTLCFQNGEPRIGQEYLIVLKALRYGDQNVDGLLLKAE